jgi:hypothetical protein
MTIRLGNAFRSADPGGAESDPPARAVAAAAHGNASPHDPARSEHAHGLTGYRGIVRRGISESRGIGRLAQYPGLLRGGGPTAWPPGDAAASSGGSGPGKEAVACDHGPQPRLGPLVSDLFGSTGRHWLSGEGFPVGQHCYHGRDHGSAVTPGRSSPNGDLTFC